MNMFPRKLFVCCLCLILFWGAQVSARPLPTTISTDGDPLKAEPVSICSPITVGKNAVINILGKVLNIPSTVKVENAGFLFNALSGDALQGKPTDPKGFQATTTLPYLKKSKELEDSLKLRRTARNIKFQVISETLKKVTTLSEEQKKVILDFLSKQIGAPLYCFDKSPLPNFLPQPGPCMIPIGVQLIDPTSGKEIGLDTSVICLVDIVMEGKTYFSIKDSITNDTLACLTCTGRRLKISSAFRLTDTTPHI
ncbi:hypothetical protein HYY75_09410 [bacterium]|nr:hypothetical protein [bacterium]